MLTADTPPEDHKAAFQYLISEEVLSTNEEPSKLLGLDFYSHSCPE